MALNHAIPFQPPGRILQSLRQPEEGAHIARDLGQVDMVVYSLAAPARQMPDGELVRSTLKPIGESFSGATIDFNSSEIRPVSLEPASAEEIADTVKVMGGDDWERWIAAALLLA